MALNDVLDVCGRALTSEASANLSAEEILEYLANHGTINLEETAEQIVHENRHKYLEKHKYAISFDKQKDLWRTSLPDPTTCSGRRFIKRKNKEDLEEEIIKFYIALDEGKKYTVETAMKEFIKYRYPGEQHGPSRRKATFVYERFFASIGHNAILEMKEGAWTLYLERIVREKHPKHKAFAEACSLLRMTLRYLKKLGKIKLDIEAIFEDVECNENDFDTSTKDEATQVFYPDDAKELVSYLWEHKENPRNLLLLLVYATGIRIGEAVALKHSDLQDYAVRISRTMMGCYYDENGNNIQTTVKDKPKTKAGQREIVISPGADMVMEEIRKLNPESEYIFLNDKGQPFSQNAIRCHLYKICQNKLKMPKRPPHSLRRTYASILDENKIEDAAIVKQMGHANITTTRRFYVKNRNNIEDMRHKLDGIKDLNIEEILSESS